MLSQIVNNSQKQRAGLLHCPLYGFNILWCPSTINNLGALLRIVLRRVAGWTSFGQILVDGWPMGEAAA